MTCRIASSSTTTSSERTPFRSICAAAVAVGDRELLVFGVPVERDDSMRSSSGCGIVSVTLAAMNSTCDRSRSTSIVVRNVWFCAGSGTRAGRRWISAPVVAHLRLVEQVTSSSSGIAQEPPGGPGGPDIGASVTADLGLVADAAEADATNSRPWRARPTRPRSCRRQEAPQADHAGAAFVHLPSRRSARPGTR